MKKKIIESILIFAIVLLALNMAFENQNEDAFNRNGLIRLRIIANSDLAEDQKLKREIRDAIVQTLGPMLKKAQSVEEAREQLTANMEMVKRIAEREIAISGKDYAVDTNLGIYKFPTKSYGNMNFAAGEYEALRVVIGEGKGDNWWCVLFPPLCFVDMKNGLAIKNLSPEQLEKKTVEEVNKLPVEVRFKTIELLKKSDEKYARVFAKEFGDSRKWLDFKWNN